MIIQANDMHFQTLNDLVRQSADQQVVIEQCIGQRYIGSGLSDKKIVIKGTPGNALGAYLDGADITVYGNGQDAIGDTMNEGRIIIHGSCGDATGYAMRGGKIYAQGNAGYRAGIHMKAYKEKLPVLMIGGTAGSFLGEYQAGGLIIVLGLERPAEQPIVGYFCGTGMHGGKIYLRCPVLPDNLPAQVAGRQADDEDMAEIMTYIDEYCMAFDYPKEKILAEQFYVLLPNQENPYEQLYTEN